MSPRLSGAAAPDSPLFDPTDLAMLGAGWVSAGYSLTLEDADLLHSVALMLHRLYEELIDKDGYPGVWAYEVAEPLGKRLAQEHEATLANAEAIAREWITAELERIV